MPRKRAVDEAALDESILLQDETPKDTDTLSRLRNMWQFASFMQYVYFFGRIVKIDDSLDMDEFEEMCLFPEKSSKLADLGLALLKYVSSHRGLTPEIFDEYTRRQYLAKAPSRNPFGDEEEPKKFKEFDIYTKIKVLHQLSVWTLGNAERIRAQMEERESEQTAWRIEPFGWDSDDRTYFLLDDDRLYRMTDAPIPATPVKTQPKSKSKSKTKPRARGTRASKRIRLSSTAMDSEDEEDETMVDETIADVQAEDSQEDNDFGGMKWECIAVTMDEYQDFLESLRRSRDPNEKALYKATMESVMPILEKRSEAQRQKALKRQRELENIQKMATAKRSSRLADKQEKQREAEEAAEAERKRLADLAMARKEQHRQLQMEEARQSRMQTREQRLKEREVRRILHEEELKKLEELESQGDDVDARHSARHLKSELERHKKELSAFKEEEDKWVFDCAGCGLYGENIDDGTHSVACERCSIWQHSKCNGIDAADAEREDFHFVCSDCKRKEEDAKKPKIPPLKLGKIHSPASSQTTKTEPDSRPATAASQPSPSNVRIVEGVSILRAQPSQSSPAQARPEASSGARPQPYMNGSTAGHAQLPTNGQQSPYAYGSYAQPLPSHMHTHQQIHQQAHQNHTSHSPYGTYRPPGHTNGMSPPAPMQASSSHSVPQPAPQSSYMNSFKANGAASPVKKQQTPSPVVSRQIDRVSPNPQLLPMNANATPYRAFSPPSGMAQQQRLAGHSPVKQASPSPRGGFQGPQFLQSSPALPPPQATPSTYMAPPIHATPAAQVAPQFSSPATNLLPATPMAVSSPIPPVGDGPVIPQKHDPSRPASRDHAAEVPVFPPKTNLSPSRFEDGKGMDTKPGEGGLGTGNIPVKKMPEQGQEPGVVPMSSPPALSR